MKTRTSLIVIGLTIALAGWTTAGSAQTLPKLPEGYVFSGAEGSPGKVTFNHASHVNQSRPDCTGCHPALFKILQKGTPAGGAAAIRHSEMQEGRQCGSCHNDKAAFGLTNCPACHRME
jgi:c(7)-type cytochrome triheme protein